ncbi:MAG: 2-succinyl-6-hydroxy-2,4-cyclohexadiene-1-carboxylate synthase [Longimicrobiales bacterium]
MPPAPVLLHGFSATSLAWGRAVVEGLASGVGPPVLLDAPGHGARADAEAGAFDLEAVHAAISAALGPEPSPLIGYSMGGRLALSFAAAHPGRVSRLVLESASPGLADPAERAARRDADETLAARIEEWGMEWFVDYWDGLPLFESRQAVPGPERARQRALRLANRPGGLARALRRLGTGALPPVWDDLPGTTVPTLLIVGALDRKFVAVAEAMAERLPDARTVVVPDAGHTVHLERPGAWLDAVVRFLQTGA